MLVLSLNVRNLHKKIQSCSRFSMLFPVSVIVCRYSFNLIDLIFFWVYLELRVQNDYYEYRRMGHPSILLSSHGRTAWMRIWIVTTTQLNWRIIVNFVIYSRHASAKSRYIHRFSSLREYTRHNPLSRLLSLYQDFC